MTTAYVVIEHDDDPDFSWLDQDTEAASRDPADYVSLRMLAYDENDAVIDSLHSIDFLATDADWDTGAFDSLAGLAGYPHLREIAEQMGLRA
jgi:hypothetical protein